jgi:hypothetical protein
MDNPDLTLDDLHDDDNPAVVEPTPTPAEPEPPAEPVPTEPSNTEPEPTPPAEPDSTEPEPPAEPAPSASGDASGLELFLSQYDIEGGMITYDDGTSVHVSELSPEEQSQILSSVASDARPSVEDQYDLDPTEISLLNELRNSEKSVEDYVNDLAQARFNAYRAEADSMNVDYEQMEDDAIYVKFLKNQNKEISETEIESGLEAAKQNPTYDTLVKGLREGFQKDQALQIEAKTKKEAADTDLEMEKDRQSIVDAASTINDIGGFEIPREVKNDVLHDLLEVNEFGDSLFLENTFSDPTNMFKTAWFSKYGEGYLSDIENYYKQEITKAYNRGRKSITEGLPSNPQSIHGSPPPKPVMKGGEVFDPDGQSSMDLDELHGE